MAIIEVNNIVKTFKIPKKKETLSKFKQKINLFYREWENKDAVNDISFEINEGEIVGYIGANGAGKSTTIKMLTGILIPNKGTIKIMGLDPSKDRMKYTQNIGVVFGQRKNLIYDIPIKDSYGIFRAIYEIPKKIYEERLDYLTNVMEIKHIMEVPYRKLSLGEQMRAEIVSCFLHDPKIVFLDEPTIGLDVYAKHKIREFLKKINEEKNVTIILTTHDTLDIEQLAKRIILIENGKKLFDGTLIDFKKNNSNGKKIEVICKERPNSFLLNNPKISKWDEKELILIVNVEKENNLKNILVEILDSVIFVDIKIENESLEDLIKRVYKEKKVSD